jgi:imidazole glycerol-phosphate synthase subunit HisH
MKDALSKRYLAIVDFGLGNLFSIKNACDFVGTRSIITSDIQEIISADGVILPGVGAFPDAMNVLESRGLIDPLHEIVEANKPIIGICLGMQLLMRESYEFGHQKGLGFLEGSVLRLKESNDENKIVKVPQIGWNRVYQNISAPGNSMVPNTELKNSWDGTPLECVTNGEFMYFVHSYYVKPDHSELTMAITRYGSNVFCSAIRKGNIFGLQFHPERSGKAGLKIYENIANIIS